MAFERSLHTKKMSSRSMPPPGMTRGNTRSRFTKDFTPVTWQHYFEKCEDIQVGSDTFRVYESGCEGPAVIFLHGGGHSSLSWAVLSASLSKIIKCRILAIDSRGHGNTQTTNDDDLSANVLSRDIGNVVDAFYGDEVPHIILVGHSMGGAIAVHTGAQNILPTLIGIVVIDVVEGTALDSLRSMQSFLSSRPAQFKSLENAIEWSVKTGQIRNIESAKVSMSGQLRRVKEKEQDSVDAVTEGTSRVTGTITEEEEEDGENATKSSQCTTVKKGNKDHYTWRIDLSRTEKHWQGWFKGLSCLFLSCDVPKILVLAGVNRLDRELTIGQMQGKFQMQVLPQCGHSVHEDAPEKVAEVLASFMVRHKFAEPTADFKRPMPAC